MIIFSQCKPWGEASVMRESIYSNPHRGQISSFSPNKERLDKFILRDYPDAILCETEDEEERYRLLV
jgi:hypothetical protein